MVKVKSTTSTQTQPSVVENPNVLVYNFLKANKLRIKLEAVEPDGGFIGSGFILERRPILKVVFERI